MQPNKQSTKSTMKNLHEPWQLDRRFWYVFFSTHNNAFDNGHSGPCLAVVDDFGNLVPTGF